ncbi:MAG: hypothetical protein ACKVP0_09360 [Pirellulaceae bacterium]
MTSTTTAAADGTTWTKDFGRSWNEFWFRPCDPTLTSLLRIGVGLIALLHLASYSGDLVRWFAADGLLPTNTVDALLGGGGTFHPTYLSFAGSASILWILHACGLVAAIMLTLGLFSRASAAVTAVATLGIANRAPIIGGQVEPVLVFMLLYLCVAPSGARFSLDTFLRPQLKEFPLSLFAHKDEPSVFANLSLRLMQVHFAAFYLMMALAKTYGDAWWDGAAAWHLLAQTHSRPMDLSSLRGSEFLLNAWTHFIAWTQLLFPFLVWNRFSRPVIVAAAALMWLSLLPLTGLTSFCLLMFVGLACFLPAETFARWHTVAKA